MNLSLVPRGARVVVRSVSGHDAFANRLRELGFVAGEAVQVIAHGPLGSETLAVSLGGTRFALRRGEAERVQVSMSSEVA